MRRQKGQVIVEFAIVLPLFLFMIFGLIYSGMLFHDYSTLSNVARSAAREAAIMTSTDYSSISNHYATNDLLTSLYTQQSFSIQKGANDDNNAEVYVKIIMKRNFSFPLIESVLPEMFNIVYYMRKDQTLSSSGS